MSRPWPSREATSPPGKITAVITHCTSRGAWTRPKPAFRKALARQPDNQKARNNLGLVLCRQGREAEALAMWREALSDTSARQRMGEAMAALGKDVPPSLAGPLPQTAPPRIPPPPVHRHRPQLPPSLPRRSRRPPLFQLRQLGLPSRLRPQMYLSAAPPGKRQHPPP